VLDKLLGVSADQPSSPAQAPPTGDVSEQVRLFMLQPNIPRQQLATSWWRDNAALSPDVAAVAQ